MSHLIAQVTANAISVNQVQLFGVRIAGRPLDKPEAEETDIEVGVGLHIGVTPVT